MSNYNYFVEQAANGIEPEAGEITLCSLAKAVGEPPFYAVQRFVLSRKTMGGIRIDTSARVVDVDGTVIPGLYAAGEASGFAGINGRAALEGTHLGPSIVTGRVAGRQMAAELAGQPAAQVPVPSVEPPYPPMPVTDRSDAVCSGCHDLPVLIQQNRQGYEHFQWSHRTVLDEQMTCITCHESLFPYAPVNHHLDISRATEICARCHES